jgi:hypothetical protein
MARDQRRARVSGGVGMKRGLYEIEDGVELKVSREAVQHPAHYGGDTTYEVIKVLEAWKVLDFCLGNAIKYIARAGVKHPDPLEDLKKARWYLDRRIQQLEDCNVSKHAQR